MDMQRLLQQVFGRMVRQWVNKGVRKGLETAIDRTAPKNQSADLKAQRQQSTAGKDAVRRLQQAQKMLRMFRR